MTIITTHLRDVRFALQEQAIRQRLATPSTRSACHEKPRFHWSEPTAKKPPVPMAPAEVAWVKARGHQGLTVMQMSRELNVHHSTIVRVLRRSV